jgi:hypothetical protein
VFLGVALEARSRGFVDQQGNQAITARFGSLLDLCMSSVSSHVEVHTDLPTTHEGLRIIGYICRSASAASAPSSSSAHP